MKINSIRSYQFVYFKRIVSYSLHKKLEVVLRLHNTEFQLYMYATRESISGITVSVAISASGKRRGYFAIRCKPMNNFLRFSGALSFYLIVSNMNKTEFQQRVSSKDLATLYNARERKIPSKISAEFGNPVPSRRSDLLHTNSISGEILRYSEVTVLYNVCIEPLAKPVNIGNKFNESKRIVSYGNKKKVNLSKLKSQNVTKNAIIRNKRGAVPVTNESLKTRRSILKKEENQTVSAIIESQI